MPIVLSCWKGDVPLPLDHGNVVAGLYSGGWLITRDDAVEALDLALKVAGPEKSVEELRAAIAEDEDCAMIAVNERASRPSSVA